MDRQLEQEKEPEIEKKEEVKNVGPKWKSLD